ncbi:MAG: hypothetical protein ABR499_10140, partial [Gemmatimonadaceae bacterium]
MIAGGLAVAGAACAARSAAEIQGPPQADLRNDPFLDTVQTRTFRWFWELTDARTGLTPDRWPTRTFSSVAAIGFGLSAYIVGAERGYVTRAAAAERTLTTLRYLYRLPQDSTSTGVAGYRGFFYHFLDFDRGLRFQRVELSTIDTALLLAGALTCSSTSTAATRRRRRSARTRTRSTGASTGGGRAPGRPSCQWAGTPSVDSSRP